MFFIIWGTKDQQQELGAVADWCDPREYDEILPEREAERLALSALAARTNPRLGLGRRLASRARPDESPPAGGSTAP